MEARWKGGNLLLWLVLPVRHLFRVLDTVHLLRSSFTDQDFIGCGKTTVVSLLERYVNG